MGLLKYQLNIARCRTFWIGFAEINKLLRYARTVFIEAQANDRHCEERSDEAI